MQQAKTYTADRVLTKFDIVEYLVSRGLRADDSIKGRKLFCCPLHHEDTPSFVVYPPNEKSPYQSYFCYGCKSGGNFITLKSKLEGISFKDVVGQLAEGMGIKLEDQWQYAIEQLSRANEDGDEEEIEDSLLIISRSVYEHLQTVNHDDDEFRGCEKLLKIVDEYAERHHKEQLLKLSNDIPEYLGKRARAFHEQREKQRAEATRAYASIK